MFPRTGLQEGGWDFDCPRQPLPNAPHKHVVLRGQQQEGEGRQQRRNGQEDLRSRLEESPWGLRNPQGVVARKGQGPEAWSCRDWWEVVPLNNSPWTLNIQ